MDRVSRDPRRVGSALPSCLHLPTRLGRRGSGALPRRGSLDGSSGGDLALRVRAHDRLEGSDARELMIRAKRMTPRKP